MFGNTPLTAGQKGVALALPFLKVCSFGACSYVLWVPSSTWPVVLRWVQHNLLITAQTLAGFSWEIVQVHSVLHHYIC